jgi:L-alanine-DL-glutamate epimerase-like enolase superfamily enzyme
MHMGSDVRVAGVRLYFLPVQTRVPLKFGMETLTSVTCARACVTVRNRQGRRAEGWGETPLSVQWVWPSGVLYADRHEALKAFCWKLASAFRQFGDWGHPLEVGYDFQEQVAPMELSRFNREERHGREPMPWLAALLACSVFDQALHDAYGQMLGRPVYDTYRAEFMSRDLASFLRPAAGAKVGFAGRYPADYLLGRRRERLRAWHLVGGMDPLETADLTGNEPDDGYPVLLAEWIERDGLKCLKVKLRGNDVSWDYDRLVRVGRLALVHGVDALSADFNCMVMDPGYVMEVLERLQREEPAIERLLLYVEQPFPYDLERHRFRVHALAARKPLFLDESAHDWRLIRLGRELGWNGVALKTCKTQTGAVLGACWARAHEMLVMVQDLTNPMLAQIPHLLLAAHLETLLGVETNSMQFYPEASSAEATVHPGAYQRRNGEVDVSTVAGPGFGYSGAEGCRELPVPAAVYE